MTLKTRKPQPLRPTDVVAALEILGVAIQYEQGDEVYGLCPMHELRVGKPDTKPSWSVNKLSGLSHCFSCGYSSSFVGLVMDVLKLGDIEAVRWVRRNGLSLDILDQIPGRRGDLAEGARKRPRIVPESVFSGYETPPEKALRARLVTAEACEYFGVLFDRSDGAWIIPIRWPDGVLMGYQWKRGAEVLNEPKRMRKAGALFGVPQLDGRRMVLVESPLDVVRLHAEGIKGGVSSFGAHVSDEQVRIISEYAESIVIALDNDAPGQRESERLLRVLGRRLPVYVFNYDRAEPLPGKEGKDPGELVRASLYRGIATAKHSLEV